VIIVKSKSKILAAAVLTLAFAGGLFGSIETASAQYYYHGHHYHHRHWVKDHSHPHGYWGYY
jgi:hypothetical protein